MANFSVIPRSYILMEGSNNSNTDSFPICVFLSPISLFQLRVGSQDCVFPGFFANARRTRAAETTAAAAAAARNSGGGRSGKRGGEEEEEEEEGEEREEALS